MDAQTFNRSVVEARKRVISILKSMLSNQLDNIFYLLSLRYAVENVSTVLIDLKSRNPKLRITALEFLDNLLEPDLKRILIPLFEVAIIDIKHRTGINNLKIIIPDKYGCLRSMLNSGKNIRVKIATLNLISQINNEAYLPLVEDCLKFNDPELHAYAKAVLKELKKNSEVI